MVDRADPRLLAGLALVGDVDLGGRVLTDQNRGQAWSTAASLALGRNDRGDARADIGGYRLAIDDLGAHEARWIGA
jgi:hypothetical protein